MEKLRKYLNAITPISDQEFADSIHFFVPKKIKKGDYFVRQNQVCSHLAFILSGTIRMFYINEKAEEITACFCTENHLTSSYKSFVLQEPSHLILQAITDLEVLIISHGDLQKMYDLYPVWNTIGRSIVEQEYFRMEQYAAVLNNESAKEKYLRLLKEQPEVLQVANIEDIATYLGITRRTLSRIRQEIAT